MTAQQMRELLDAPLPAEAIKPHPSKNFLSTINSIYVTERLNDVFGVGRWGTTSEIIENSSKMVVLKVHFWAYSPVDGADMVKLEAYGGNDNDDRGDAYKGAMTDALTKIGSFLGIGADVWKGKAPTGRPSTPSARGPARQDRSGPSGGSPATSAGLPWLNITDRKGKMTTLGEEICRRVKAGEVTLNQLHAEYRISGKDQQRLESLGAEAGPSHHPGQDVPTDNLPF